MSSASEERFRKLRSRFNGAAPQNSPRPARTARVRNGSSGSRLLTDLLGAVPIDLARISEHIRSHPKIADLIIRLAGSLLLSADSGITIEEAAVMLGTDRLHVLASMWSIIEKYDEGGRAEKSPDVAAESAENPRAFWIHGTNWTAQSLYLATFLRVSGIGFSRLRIAPRSDGVCRAGLADAGFCGPQEPLDARLPRTPSDSQSVLVEGRSCKHHRQSMKRSVGPFLSERFIDSLATHKQQQRTAWIRRRYHHFAQKFC